MRTIWFVITYCTISPHLPPDGIASCTILWHESTYEYAHPCSSWIIHPVYFQLHFHIWWSRMMFSQSSMCASRFSQHIIKDFWLNCYSTFSFSRLFELNIQVHLCFNSTVLIVLSLHCKDISPSICYLILNIDRYD